MLVKPILANIRIINAINDNTISFITVGGEQWSGFQYEIYNNATSQLVKTETINSSTPIINIVANTLTNGTNYNLRVRTTNGTSYSEYSDYMILKVYSNAVVSINNFVVENGVNKVKNQRYVFDGSYTQAENVLLKSFQYIIYDSNRNVIKEFTPVYVQNGNSLQQKIDGLDNYSNYYIELKCIDQNDNLTTSGIIQFYVEYKPPRIRQVISLTNKKDDASVLIETDIRQLIFKGVGDYILDATQINLSADGSYVYMDDAFDVSSEFTMQLWCITCVKDKDIIILKRDNVSDDVIRIRYSTYDNMFHAIKIVNGIIMEYISDVYIISDSTPFTLFMQQIKGRIDLIAESVVG